MKIVVVNRSFERIGMIENASVIWASRYYKCGDFQLKFTSTNENLELIKSGYFIVRDDDEDNVGIIEDFYISKNESDGGKVIVIGKFAPMLLGKRIIEKQTQMYGNVESNIKNLINANVINPDKSCRVIDCVELAPKNPNITEKINMQTTGDNLLTKIEEINETYGLGFKMPMIDNKLKFTMYKGVDRSYNQTANPWVIFSDVYDNLKEPEYSYQTSEYKNVFLIATEGEGLDRKTLWGSAQDNESEITGLDRNEIYVDQRNMSSNEEDITEEEFLEQMNEEGKTNLTTISEAFSGAISTQGYEYKKHYFLGDIVTIQVKEWNNIYANVRIIEAIESEDENGKVLTLTYGK